MYVYISPLLAVQVTAATSLSSCKVSWLILSRAGVNYLTHSGLSGSWLICPAHRREFHDAWEAKAECSYPPHDRWVPRIPARHNVTLAMSARLLQVGEGRRRH